MLVAKTKAYARELVFALRALNDNKSRAALVWNTILFHTSNLSKKHHLREKSFRVNFRCSADYNAIITLRRFSGDLFVLYEVFLDKSYFVPSCDLPQERVKVIVDCGANVGMTSLYLADRYRNAKIYSVEPHPENFRLLLDNARNEPRIVPIQGAIVGQQVETVWMSADAPSWGNKLVHSQTGIEVPAFTLADLCQKFSITEIDLLKVDIEGAEESVFANAEFLPVVKFGMIELHGEYSREKFDEDIAKWNFVSRAPNPNLGLKLTTFARQETDRVVPHDRVE
jgi:FkbM family methyltransferase